MSRREGCNVDLIAQGEGCAVGRCRHCGTLHLNIGGRMTLCITEERLLDMADTLSAAAQCLDAWPEE